MEVMQLLVANNAVEHSIHINVISLSIDIKYSREIITLTGNLSSSN